MKKFLLATIAAVLMAFTAQAQVVFSEIMYNPPETGNDSLEYIEIVNTGNTAVNLNGYTLEGVTHTFGAVTLAPGQYYALCKSPSAMVAVFGATVPAFEAGALSNNGETVRLKNAAGAIVDSVSYGTIAPWPTEAYGAGSSLELCNISANNDDPANWAASIQGTSVLIGGIEAKGTPGVANTAPCPGAAAAVVTVGNFSFSPADVTIYVGETVEWNFVAGNHNVNGQQSTYPNNPESFYSGTPMAAPYTYEYTFNTPGVYDYRCDPHFAMGMVGTVTVIQPEIPTLVITEILYKDPTPTDTAEFVEIYNYGTEPVSLEGITFSMGVGFTWTSGTILPNEAIIVARSPQLLQQFTPASVYQFTGALLNTGETIQLKTAEGFVIDEVAYSNVSPWPVLDTTQRVSLMLCDPTADNSIPSNWVANPNQLTVPGPWLTFVDPGTVEPCPDEAIANDDAWTIDQGQQALFDFTFNDYVPAGVASVTLLGSSGTSGLFEFNDGILLFIASETECGPMTFDYEVCDLLGNCDQASATITVNCPFIYPIYNVSEVTQNDATGTADSVGVICQLEGVVYGVNLRPAGLQFVLIDEGNDGIALFNNAGNFGYTVNEGDKIVVRGTIAQFNGLTQIVPDTLWKVSEGNNLFPPTAVTALGEETESQLVRIGDSEAFYIADATQWVPTGAGFNIDVTDGTTTFNVRIDNDVDIFTATPLNTGDVVRITGLGGQFDNASPFENGYQLLPRYLSDIEVIVPTQNLQPQAVRVQPNPFRQNFVVSSDETISQVRVTDALGRTIYAANNSANTAEIQTQNWPNGVYIVTATIGNKTAVQRVVKH